MYWLTNLDVRKGAFNYNALFKIQINGSDLNAIILAHNQPLIFLSVVSQELLLLIPMNLILFVAQKYKFWNLW